MKWLKRLLGLLWALLLLLVLAFFCPIFADDKPILIYESELQTLIQLTGNLKFQLALCQTNSEALLIQFDNLSNQIESSESNIQLLSGQLDLSTNQLSMLSQAQTELTNSWQLYKREAEIQIKKLESERLFYIGGGLLGLILGISLAIIF